MKSSLEKWIQYDTNPLIIFSSDGKVLYLNEAGEYLLSFVSPKKVYELIITFAPQEANFEYIKEQFIFGDFIYDYALIGYENFEEIGVRFYKNIEVKKRSIDFENLETINLYFILDFARTYSLIEKDVKFIDIFDPDLPEIKFKKDELIKLFSEIYLLVKDNKSIKTEVKIKIGEYIRLNNKKYKIIEIDIFGENIEYKKLEFENVKVDILGDKISILIPLII